MMLEVLHIQEFAALLCRACIYLAPYVLVFMLVDWAYTRTFLALTGRGLKV